MSQGDPVLSISKVFAHVNESKPKEYHDYDNYAPTWNAQTPYEIVKKVGRGKYSEVFQGIDTRTNKKIIIKILKPVKRRKIKREIRILTNLQGATNVIKLIDTVRDAHSKTCSLIFEYVDNKDFKVLFPKITDIDIRHYIFQVLRGLHDCHSRGIMHRDVKPHNVMIDHNNKTVRLIDWGLAEFYHPGVQYNVRVASRYFKGPELLTDMRSYDYSLDLWSVGCMLAGMIYICHPFFHGRDNNDQLVKITEVLGSQTLSSYLEKYNLKLPAKRMIRLTNLPAVSFKSFRTDRNKHLANDVAIDLLSQLLVMDHQQRLTCEEALLHPYFDPVRKGYPSLNKLPNNNASSTSSDVEMN